MRGGGGGGGALAGPGGADVGAVALAWGAGGGVDGLGGVGGDGIGERVAGDEEGNDRGLGGVGDAGGGEGVAPGDGGGEGGVAAVLRFQVAALVFEVAFAIFEVAVASLWLAGELPGDGLVRRSPDPALDPCPLPGVEDLVEGDGDDLDGLGTADVERLAVGEGGVLGVGGGDRDGGFGNDDLGRGPGGLPGAAAAGSAGGDIGVVAGGAGGDGGASFAGGAGDGPGEPVFW